jgi:hypothetical protein
MSPGNLDAAAYPMERLIQGTGDRAFGTQLLCQQVIGPVSDNTAEAGHYDRYIGLTIATASCSIRATAPLILTVDLQGASESSRHFSWLDWAVRRHHCSSERSPSSVCDRNPRNLDRPRSLFYRSAAAGRQLCCPAAMRSRATCSEPLRTTRLMLGLVGSGTRRSE